MNKSQEASWTTIRKVLKETRINVLLCGPPGVGKTHSALDYAKSVNLPLLRVHMHQTMEAQDLCGLYAPHPDTGKWSWFDQPALRAWKHGILLIDELPRAQGSAHDVLLGALDDPEVASWTMPWGEELKPHDAFRCIATSNDPPEVLEPALKDRLLPMWIQTPPPEAMKKLKSKTGIQEAVEKSYEAYDFKRHNDLVMTFRDGQRLLELEKVFGLKDAVSIVYNETTKAREVWDMLRVLQARKSS